MSPTPRLAFGGVIRTYLALAVASIFLDPLFEGTAPLRVVPVRAEHAGGGELAQLVPDHGLGDEHGEVLAAVVDGDRVPDHLRHDRRAAGSRPAAPPAATPGQLLGPCAQLLIDA